MAGQRARGKLGRARLPEHDRIYPPLDRIMRASVTWELIQHMDMELSTSEQNGTPGSSSIPDGRIQMGKRAARIKPSIGRNS